MIRSWPPLVSVVLLFAAVFPPAARAGAATDVGAYLQAGSQLRQALVNGRGVVHQDLAGSIDGLELRPEREHAFDAGHNRKRIESDGRAYAAGDSVMITALLVSKREIDVVLGIGGYDPAHLEDSPERVFPGMQRLLSWQLQWLASGLDVGYQSGFWQLTSLSPQAAAARRTELTMKLGEARKAGDDAEFAALQMTRFKLARVAGSRIRLIYDHDVPLAELDAKTIRARLAPYLTLAE